jgi:hypothetical protein
MPDWENIKIEGEDPSSGSPPLSESDFLNDTYCQLIYNLFCPRLFPSKQVTEVLQAILLFSAHTFQNLFLLSACFALLFIAGFYRRVLQMTASVWSYPDYIAPRSSDPSNLHLPRPFSVLLD